MSLLEKHTRYTYSPTYLTNLDVSTRVLQQSECSEFASVRPGGDHVPEVVHVDAELRAAVLLHLVVDGAGVPRLAS